MEGGAEGRWIPVYQSTSGKLVSVSFWYCLRVDFTGNGKLMKQDPIEDASSKTDRDCGAITDLTIFCLILIKRPRQAHGTTVYCRLTNHAATFIQRLESACLGK